MACVDPTGRYIYLIDLSIRRVVAELYRGRSQTEVRSLSISHDNNYLTFVTEKSKIHMFYLEGVTKRFLEQGQKEQRLESVMRFKAQLISDLWDEKLLAKGGLAADSVK